MTTTAQDVMVSPWADRRFRLFAAGNITNNIGEAMYDLTLPLLVYELTGSLLVMTVLAAMVPATLLLGPLLGSVADRWGPRVMVTPGLFLQVGAALIINTVALSGQHTNWFLLFFFGALVQIGGSMYRVGWMTAVPLMFPETAVRARGTLGSLFIASTFIGPLIVAATLPVLGYLPLLWINLATFVAPMIVWWLGIKPPRGYVRESPRFDLARSLAQGWDAVRHERRLVGAVLTMLPLEIVASTATTTLTLFYLRESFGLSPSAVSACVVAMNLAAFLGSVAVSERTRFPVRATLAVVTVGMAGSLFVVAVPSLVVAVGALCLFFAFTGSAGVTSSMLTITYVPAEVMGRASGILRLIWGVPNLVAPAVIPVAVAWSSVRVTYILLGVVALLSVAILARMWGRWSAPVTADAAPTTDNATAVADNALPITATQAATTIPTTDSEV
jgi:MFS family permease